MTLALNTELNSTGVEWLGEVPANWEVRRLKDVSSVTPSNVDKKSYSDQIQVRLCNYTDVYYNDTITDELDFMVATASDEEVRKFGLRAGQVIITKDSETADDIGIAAFVPVTLPGVVCGYHLSIIECNTNADGRFIKRLFDSTYVKSMLSVRANGLTRVGLGQSALTSLPIPVPPIQVQRHIADYLDVQTAKIDALIGKQERLIETLAERRQAVISHAVTKGLDPNAVMNDSGVEWLGNVPLDWAVQQLRYVTDVLTGFPFKSDEYSDNEADVRLLRGINVNPGTLVWDEVVYWPRAEESPHAQYRLRKDDLVLGLDRPIVSSGTRVARVGEDDLPSLLLQRVARIRPRAHAEVKFLEYLLSGPEFRDYLAPIFTGVSVPHMSPDQLNNFRVAIPSEAEQHQIVEHLDHQTSRIDALAAKAREMIDVLKERRQALISAAVTGKIDVRGLA